MTGLSTSTPPVDISTFTNSSVYRLKMLGGRGSGVMLSVPSVTFFFATVRFGARSYYQTCFSC